MKNISTLITLTISLMTASFAAHAEKYCKSIDQSGNASYTLAPETGCKNKSKTVGVRHYIAPVISPSTPTSTANTKQNPSTSEAPVTANPVVASTTNSSSTVKTNNQ